VTHTTLPTALHGCNAQDAMCSNQTHSPINHLVQPCAAASVRMMNHSSRRQQWHDGGSHTGTGCRPNASVKEVHHAIYAVVMGALYARERIDALATMKNKCMRKKGD
jgi:cobalamin biosynthesis protein CbiG